MICVPDDTSPDVLQFAPVNVISTADCQDDWSWMNDLYICIRDDSGQQGACFVSILYLRLHSDVLMSSQFSSEPPKWD